MRRLFAPVVLGLLLLAHGSADAHTRSMSYSTWRLDDGGASVELRLKLLELTRRPLGHPWPASLPQELQLLSGGRACPSGEATRSRTAADGWAIFRWRVRCDVSGPRAISSRLFLDVAPGHTHFLRLDPRAVDRAGSIREQVLVSDRDPIWTFETGSASSTSEASVMSFLLLGVQHIATGWDHLAFVLALLLLAGSLRQVAVLVTGFTIAHSLTLGLAALGAVRPEAAAVEVMIGFSIALVAAENSWLLGGRDRALPAVLAAALLSAAAIGALGEGTLGALAWIGLAVFSACHFGLLRRSARPAQLRAALAFAFGLVHGFGFAGILMELELPATRLVPALLGFNAGVELGQLAVVSIAWPALALLQGRSQRAYRLLAEAGSAAIFALGTFWLVARNF